MRAAAGFAVLLTAFFAVSFAAGRLAGPVSPGMHRTEPGTLPATSGPGTGERPGMGGMPMNGGRP
ncbi:hypothetical protein SMC26_29480 [Actinomadura fulvescens]|uniref:Uncharacterized protein n=1 Tax=Actinomadura fulvescens TaxID=46160 RepID=A0ABN3QKK5_9ACTN